MASLFSAWANGLQAACCPTLLVFHAEFLPILYKEALASLYQEGLSGPF
ncbi:MAG: hypothetical protein NTX49_02640 [Chlamydiae bacterium]|nr:hypothetical protein [Chlamydiota bacterium]